MGDSGVDQEERQDPQDPVELQRDTAGADSDGRRAERRAGGHPRPPAAGGLPAPELPGRARTSGPPRACRTPTPITWSRPDWPSWTSIAGGDFGALSDAEATAAVERIADSAFFKLVHSTTVVALYDDREVWNLLGYEGPSYDKGGYLNRGFDDLDWLPKARITEYTDEPRPELVDRAEA